MEAICAHIKEAGPQTPNHIVDTVYFGGGTPTSLPGELLPRLLDTVTAHYRISENAEITAEYAAAVTEQLKTGGVNDGENGSGAPVANAAR